MSRVWEVVEDGISVPLVDASLKLCRLVDAPDETPDPINEALRVIGATMLTDDMPVLNAIASTEDDWIIVTLRGRSHATAAGETLAAALIALAKQVEGVDHDPTPN